MKVTNLRQKPMEYMYLCHINYRPFDGSQLVYSAVPDPAHVKVHKDIPANMPADKAARLREYMDKIQRTPAAQCYRLKLPDIRPGNCVCHRL
jgi:hypothetical protein